MSNLSFEVEVQLDKEFKNPSGYSLLIHETTKRDFCFRPVSFTVVEWDQVKAYARANPIRTTDDVERFKSWCMSELKKVMLPKPRMVKMKDAKGEVIEVAEKLPIGF